MSDPFALRTAPAFGLSRPGTGWVAPLLALLVASLPFWPFIGVHETGVVVRALLFIALGQAWNVIAGIGGQLSLGHGVFFGLGAYATALAFNLWGIPPWIGAWIGIAASLGTAFVMGRATFRLRGVYFALATVVISLGLEKLARHYIGLTGGDAGLAVRFVGDSLVAAQSRQPAPFLWAALLLVVANYALTCWLLRSRFGLELQTVRDDERAAAAVGVDVEGTKMKGLLLSAAMTSVAGSLYVQFYLAIDPAAAFGLYQAILIQLPGLIGGLGTAAGPIIGGAVMILIGEASNWASARIGIHGLDILAFGLVLLGIVLVRPGGLIGRRR